MNDELLSHYSDSTLARQTAQEAHAHALLSEWNFRFDTVCITLGAEHVWAKRCLCIPFEIVSIILKNTHWFLGSGISGGPFFPRGRCTVRLQRALDFLTPLFNKPSMSE